MTRRRSKLGRPNVASAIPPQFNAPAIEKAAAALEKAPSYTVDQLVPPPVPQAATDPAPADMAAVEQSWVPPCLTLRGQLIVNLPPGRQVPLSPAELAKLVTAYYAKRDIVQAAEVFDLLGW